MVVSHIYDYEDRLKSVTLFAELMKDLNAVPA